MDDEAVAMAIAYRSATKDLGGSDTVITISKPTGTTQDDVLLAVIHLGNSVTVTSAPSGWTEISAPGGNGTDQGKYYWARAGASEPDDYSWNLSGTATWYGQVAAFSGVHAIGNPIDTSNYTPYASGTDRTAPSITTTQNNTMCVALISTATSSAITTTSSYTVVLHTSSHYAVFAYGAQVSSGASGTKSFSVSGKLGGAGGTLHLALLEDTGGGGDDDLDTGNTDTGVPTLDNPALGHIYALLVGNFATGTPTLGNPGLTDVPPEEPSEAGGTLTPTTFTNKWALESLTM